MVVFIDYEGEDDDPYCHSSPLYGPRQHAHSLSQAQNHVTLGEKGAELHDRNDTDSNGNVFASVLACYPVSLSVAAHLDLNDLYALSVTCRKIHGSFSQFARQLRTQSMHCVNDLPPRTSEEEVDTLIFREAMNEMTTVLSPTNIVAPTLPLPFSTDASHLHVNFNSALGLSGKIRKCARDMVGPCRKCGTIVCRNCAVKPPSDRCLPNRHRRLCSTCSEAPLIDHLHPLSDDIDFQDVPPASSGSSAHSIDSVSSFGSQSDSGRFGFGGHPISFTFPSFLRQPCNCASQGVYLCQPCGQSLIAADTTYKRVWTWRSRYSTHIGGGLGTGLGLGNQGQKCGRGEYCLERGAAGVCWVEIECSEARKQSQGRDDGYGISRSSTPLTADHENEGFTINRPGYLSQELEGIGGVLKKKVKKRVKVGATVYEFDDERETGKYLSRESSGKHRSWCGWCSRVCPGEKDEADVGRLLTPHA